MSHVNPLKITSYYAIANTGVILQMKVHICHSYMWAADTFYTKPVMTDLFIFKEKYQKEIFCLRRKYQASLQKKNSWF